MTAPDTTTDYLYVDGTETVTLTDGSDTVTVEYAKRSRIEATNQISGLQIGDILWDLAKAVLDGAITEPIARMKIIDADDNEFVITSVGDLVISGIWQCVTRPAVSEA